MRESHSSDAGGHTQPVWRQAWRQTHGGIDTGPVDLAGLRHWTEGFRVRRAPGAPAERHARVLLPSFRQPGGLRARAAGRVGGRLHRAHARPRRAGRGAQDILARYPEIAAQKRPGREVAIRAWRCRTRWWPNSVTASTARGCPSRCRCAARRRAAKSKPSGSPAVHLCLIGGQQAGDRRDPAAFGALLQGVAALVGAGPDPGLAFPQRFTTGQAPPHLTTPGTRARSAPSSNPAGAGGAAAGFERRPWQENGATIRLPCCNGRRRFTHRPGGRASGVHGASGLPQRGAGSAHHRLAGFVLDLRGPLRADLRDHRLRQRDVVELLRGLFARS